MPKGLIDVIEDLLAESHDGKVKDSGDANTGDHRSSKIEADKGPHKQSTDNANDVGKSGKGNHPSAASSKIDADKGPHSQSGDSFGNTGGSDGRKAKASGASSKAEGDEGPHSQAGDSWEMKEGKDEDQDKEIGDIKSKFNKLIDAERDEPEHDDDDLEKADESHDIHIHIGDQGGSDKPEPAAKAPKGGRGDSGGDKAPDGGKDEIPADRGDDEEDDRNPSLNSEGKTYDKRNTGNEKFKARDQARMAKRSMREADMEEELIGGQKKLDKNGNGKLDADDFKMLRGEKGSVKEEEQKKSAAPNAFSPNYKSNINWSGKTKTGHTMKKVSTGRVYTKDDYEELSAMHDRVVAEMVAIIGEEYVDEYLQEDSVVTDYVHEDLMEQFIGLQELALEISEKMKKMEDEDVHLHVGGDDKGGEEGGEEKPGADAGEKPDADGKIPPKEPSKEVDVGASQPSDDEGGEEGGGEEGGDEGGEKKNPFEGKTYDKRNTGNEKYKQRQQQQQQKRAQRFAEGKEDGTDNDEHEVGKSPDQGPFDQSTCHAGDEGATPNKGKASDKVEANKGPHSQSGDNGGDTGSIDGKTAKPSGASSKAEADKGPHKQSDDGLNEDFKEKARVIFETAVNEKVATITQEMEEAYSARLAEEVEAVQELVAEAVGEAINEWLEANKLEIKYSLRTEIAENFIRGMRALVAENYIEIPPEEVSVVDELSEAVEDLKARDNDSQKLIEELQSEILAMRRDSIILAVAEDLTETQKLKLAKLSESVEAASIEEFETKLKTLKETYFAEGFDNSPLLSSLHESAVFGTEESYGDDDTSVNAYAQFLSKTSKK